MLPEDYAHTIDKVLREIPQLERTLKVSHCPDEQKKVERSLKQRVKKLERLISYQHRKSLRQICTELGIICDFS